MHASPRRITRPRRLVALAAALTIVVAACGDDDEATPAAQAAPVAAADPAAGLEGTVNFGFFPNVTHAPA
ncbi:MAG TPA: hypothetical protein VFD53_03580, partial [Ilumatobacter sp.]|nr:hypothetical protein [Ilumatobacter sp.]